MKKAGFAAVAVCLLWSSSVFAGLSGKGTAGEPYLIESLADFDEFAGGVTPENCTIANWRVSDKTGLF